MGATTMAGYILAASGTADCTGCGQAITSYDDCATAAAVEAEAEADDDERSSVPSLSRMCEDVLMREASPRGSFPTASRLSAVAPASS